MVHFVSLYTVQLSHKSESTFLVVDSSRERKKGKNIPEFRLEREQVFRSYNSHFTYRNYSQSNIWCGVGSVVKSRLRPTGDRRFRGAHRASQNLTWCYAGASRWISRTTLDGMTRRSERYFDRNEWLCGPHTAIQFQTVFFSSTRPPPADRIRIFLFRENFRRKSGAACV